MDKTCVLFVCSRNQWRSPTAEQIYRKHPNLSVRSGGTSPSAKHRVSLTDIEWADVVLVMEEKQQARLKADFGFSLQGKVIHVLDIPDDYKYMDAELVSELERAVSSVLDL